MIAVFDNRGLVDWGVDRWAWGEWSHVGVIDACERARMKIIDGTTTGDEILKLFSIIEAHKHTGVQENPSLLAENHNAKSVEIYDVPGATPEQWVQVITLMRSQIGHPYDTKGALRFVPWMRPFCGRPPAASEYADPQHDFPWFCSEITSWAFARAEYRLFDDLAPHFKIAPHHIRWSDYTRRVRVVEINREG